MKNIISIISAFIFITTGYSQSKFDIELENKNTSHQLGISEFYFVHHTFADSFFMTELYKNLDYDEMSTILKAIYYGITEKDEVKITFKDKSKQKPYLHYYIRFHNENGTTFIMMTNFNNATRKFDKNVGSEDQLARWYFIKGDKLVYRKDLYSKEAEATKKETYELIDFYLFDNNLENDAKVKPLIDDVLNSEESTAINKLYAKLYLSEYYLKNGDLENAEKSVNALKVYFETELEIPRNYGLITKMAIAEYEIMKRF